MTMVATLTLTACMEHAMQAPDDPNKNETTDEIRRNIDNSFDFKMTAEVPVTLNYGVKGALVEIYDADTEDYAVASSNVRPNKIYSAFTGQGGSYTGSMVVPATLIGKTVYAFSDAAGVSHKVAGVVTKSGIVFDGTIGSARKSITRGIPQPTKLLDKTMTDKINEVLSEGHNHDNLLQNTDINIHINKDVEYIDVTFVWGGAGTGHWTGFWGSPNDGDDVWKCQNGEAEPAWTENSYQCNLYYFTYTDQLPTAQEIEENFINNEHLVFFDADQSTSESLRGVTYRLQNGTGTSFKAGTNIGWVLTHPRYVLPYKWTSDRASFASFVEKYNITTPYNNYADFAANWHMPYIYSVKSLNPDNKNQTIRYTYGSGDDEVIVYGIEDLSVTRGNFLWGEEWSDHEQHIANREKAQFPFFCMESDRDYNDLLFIVQASDPSAIHDDDIRPIEEQEPEPSYSAESIEGTLLFEDLFPNAGDYDMNDVVITYSLTKYFDQDNNMVRLAYEFTPVWSGADYHSSFSFLFDDLTDVVTVFNDQTKYVRTYRATDKLTTFTGEITSGNFVGKNKDEFSWDAFNPFITIRNTGYEVHLPKKAPSANAKLDGLNEYARNYVLSPTDAKTEGEFPYAMNIPTTGYVIVTEKVRIDEEYPYFATWVATHGAQGKDWYQRRKN